LKYILERTNKKSILEVWPNLELFTHGGVSFIPYREQYEKLIPSDGMNYLETYTASEGFFGIQDEPHKDDLLLMLDYGIFYEFIPIEHINEENPKVYTLENIEVNKNYAMLISTNSGLWRYMIGDTIKFTSTTPHKIKITGRTKHFINVFGEELMINNAEEAIRMACEKTGAMVNEYTAAPVFMGDECKGCHEWLFEFEKKPDNIEHFTDLLDNALKMLNSDYEAKRYKDLTLVIPKVVVLKNGTFYNWLKEKNKLGGQNKIPRLSNSREYVDELMKIDVRNLKLEDRN